MNLKRNYFKNPLKRGEYPEVEDIKYLFLDLNYSKEECAKICKCNVEKVKIVCRKNKLRKTKEQRTEQRRRTNLLKYGCINVSQNSSIKEKKKETTFKHYGVENPAQSKLVFNKIKETCLERYGVESSNSTQEKKQKIKETNKRKYGFEYAIQNPDIKKKHYETYIKNTYGDKRRTSIDQIEVTKEKKEELEIKPEKCVVVMTKNGKIKRIPISTFKPQKRNGKGIKNNEDIISEVIRTNTIDSLMIFTNLGKVYKILVNDIPSGTNISKGTLINELIKLENKEEPTIIYSIYKDTTAKNVIFVTKKGNIKKTSLEEYKQIKRKNGIKAINLDDDDLASVFLSSDEDILILSKNGMIIRIDNNDIPLQSRNAKGVKGINLKDEDYVITSLPIRNENDFLAIFCENGTGKKTNLKEFAKQKRNGRGILGISKLDKISDATLINDEDNILIIGDKNSICLNAKEIKECGRATIGNQLIKNNKILSVSKT